MNGGYPVNEHADMNGYMIEPWDHLTMTQSPDGSVHDQYVPPELEALARQVMENYDMSVSEMTLITAKPDKGGAIWRIVTDHGPRSIKVLHRTPHRSLFSIGAQDYLVRQGALVPALIPTTQGDLYVNAGGKSWIVTEWIEPLTPVSKIDLSGVQELCRGLGEFHRLSRGYEPPFGAVKASRLYRWPQHYEKIISKLQWFEEIANIYSEFPAATTLRSILPQIRAEANDYYTMFRDSAYQRMTAKGEPYWGLAHQDYGWSNGQMGPGGVWVIDLDGVAYDIPIRDLRKLMTSTMVDNGGWDLAWIRGMIEAYNEGNPIDRETFELLWIDMAFPNEFYKHVKEVVYEPEVFMQTELEPILNTMQMVDQNKWDVLNELRGDMELYPPGDYPAVDDVQQFAMPTLLPGAAIFEPWFMDEAVPGAAARIPQPAVFEAEPEVMEPVPVEAVTMPVQTSPQQAPAPLLTRRAVRIGGGGGSRRSRRRRGRRQMAGRRAGGARSARSRRTNRTAARSRTPVANRATRNTRNSGTGSTNSRRTSRQQVGRPVRQSANRVARRFIRSTAVGIGRTRNSRARSVRTIRNRPRNRRGRTA